jgi:3-hydroxybutyryl-CoA dehydrogenase
VSGTNGCTAESLAKRNGRPCVVLDYRIEQGATRLAFANSSDVSDAWLGRFAASAAAAGVKLTRLPDWPGLLVMRTLATLANEGFEAVLQGVASEADVDSAMRYGVNYPAGPIERARDIGLDRIVAVLDEIHRLTGDPRYRPSLALRMAA